MAGYEESMYHNWHEGVLGERLNRMIVGVVMLHDRRSIGAKKLHDHACRPDP